MWMGLDQIQIIWRGIGEALSSAEEIHGVGEGDLVVKHRWWKFGQVSEWEVHVDETNDELDKRRGKLQMRPTKAEKSPFYNCE
jgi:hypothetical protein